VLFIRPDQGWPADKSVFMGRQASVKNLERVEVEGGHHVHLEHPERLQPVITGFLSEA
jgi:pimeloyl-ACP methyl ester carboxylesterase